MDLDSKAKSGGVSGGTEKRVRALPPTARLLLPSPAARLLRAAARLLAAARPLADDPPLQAIVVMFCDICDSTAMSEALDAEDVREVVLVYQKFCGEILNSLDGHIAQYLGDGILT